MKKSCLVMGLIVLLIAGLSIVQLAFADAQLREDGSVTYVMVPNENALRTYIDENGTCSSSESIKKGSYSAVTYPINVEEPGTLLLMPLNENKRGELSLYNDFNLTSKLITVKSVQNSLASITSIHVESGTYYYRLFSKNSDARITVFIGFIPDSGMIRNETSSSQNTSVYPAVNVINVSSADELASYIDSNGIPSSSSIIVKGGNGKTETFQFSIDRPGRLVISAISNLTLPSHVKCYLYSNNELSSLLLKANCVHSSMDQMNTVSNVTPGTYYYNCQRTNVSNETIVHVYIGFIPAETTTRVDRYAYTENGNANLEISQVQNTAQFLDMVNAGEYTVKNKMARHVSSDEYCFTLEEPSLVYLALACDGKSSSSYYGYLYSDKNHISRIARLASYKTTDKKQKYFTYLLDAGDYYYFTYSQYNSGTAYSYISFTPVSAILSIDCIALSDDHSSATVTFNIAEEYDPDLLRSEIRVETGVVKARSIDGSVWKEDTRENVIPSHEFIATENGLYTVRIAGPGVQSYLLTFEVEGIGDGGEEVEIEV